MDKDTIGDRVRKVRKRFGLSQEKFAEELNTYRIRIVRIENNQIQPTFQEIIDICSKYNADIEFFVVSKPLSTQDFIKISDRYINNDVLTYDEMRMTLENIYISLAQKHLRSTYSRNVTYKNKYIKSEEESNKINIEHMK